MGSPTTGNAPNQVGDHGRAPEGHLPPGQHIAHEARGHHQQVDHNAENPEDFARGLVGAIIHAAENMDVDREEEHRRAVGVNIADQPAIIHIAHDVFNRVESHRRFRRIMHRQHNAGNDLHHQHQRQNAAESPEIIQVARHRIGHRRIMREANDRQA